MMVNQSVQASKDPARFHTVIFQTNTTYIPVHVCIYIHTYMYVCSVSWHPPSTCHSCSAAAASRRFPTHRTQTDGHGCRWCCFPLRVVLGRCSWKHPSESGVRLLKKKKKKKKKKGLPRPIRCRQSATCEWLAIGCRNVFSFCWHDTRG